MSTAQRSSQPAAKPPRTPQVPDPTKPMDVVESAMMGGIVTYFATRGESVVASLSQCSAAELVAASAATFLLGSIVRRSFVEDKRRRAEQALG